jgi:hypothetical protein
VTYTQISRDKTISLRREAGLGAAFLQTVHDMTALRESEVAALAAGGGLERFEMALSLARQRKVEAKNLYVLHIQAHGC